jgi:hypothetical protein
MCAVLSVADDRDLEARAPFDESLNEPHRGHFVTDDEQALRVIHTGLSARHTRQEM